MLSKKFKFEDEEETFYNFIESKKWKERGAALDALNKALGLDITKLPDSTENLPALKLAPGDYAPLLIKAFTSVSVISNGLRDKFKNYASLTITEILGRFKEKKATVVTAARMADSCVKTIKFPDARHWSRSCKTRTRRFEASRLYSSCAMSSQSRLHWRNRF